MSRLPFAPPLKEIAVTDVKIGRGDFTPKPAVPVSFAALKTGLKKAGYRLASAEITVAGELTRTGAQWVLIAEQSKQRFLLELPPGGASLVEASAHSEIIGAWKTVSNQEVIVLPAPSSGGESAKPAPAKPPELIDLISAETVSGGALMAAALMPIRTTSPGLTVYRGGAVSTRYSLVRQSLGGLRVTRQIVNLAVSYTPTSQLQLAAELPISRTAFSGSHQTNAGAGVGNLTLWGKYRFYRVVGQWGDRQAAARFGLEVPTGSKGAPSQQRLNATAFVRQQLTPINGGWSPRLDLAYSQAKGRMIFGGNAEAILRSARDGYRLGHEAHFNTDLEYVLWPFKYRRPTGELFGILETSFVKRGLGRINGSVAPDSHSTEFFLAPGLQYVANARVTLETSWQLPVARRVGAQVLRTNRNLLFGINVLF